jgi:hypothetical protein
MILSRTSYGKGRIVALNKQQPGDDSFEAA